MNQAPKRALIRPVGHLLPSFGREKAKSSEFIAFSRGTWAMREGGRRPDEGLLATRASVKSSNALTISFDQLEANGGGFATTDAERGDTFGGTPGGHGMK